MDLMFVCVICVVSMYIVFGGIVLLMKFKGIWGFIILIVVVFVMVFVVVGLLVVGFVLGKF